MLVTVLEDMPPPDIWPEGRIPIGGAAASGLTVTSNRTKLPKMATLEP
jgi:hypothetical protein